MKLSVKTFSSFSKNIATIMTGSVLAQVLTFMLAPILSRVYSPSEFGSIASFTAIQTILAVCSNLYYSQAIMVEKDECAAKSVSVLSIYSAVVVAGITAVACFVYGSIIERSGIVLLFLWLLPIETLMVGIGTSARVWNNRVKKYRHISAISVVYSVAQSVFSIVFGLLGMGAKGLLIGKLIALALNALLLIIIMMKSSDFSKHLFLFEPIFRMARKHSAYPLYNLPSQLLNTASEQLPIVLFSSFFGDYLTGGYTKASSYTKLPLSVVGNAFGLVFYQEASKLNNDGNHEGLRRFTLSTFRKLLLACILPLLVLSGFGDILFSFVLGKPWFDAGVYASILAPWFMLSFITSPLSTILYIKERHIQNMVINVVLLLSRVGVVLLGFFLEFKFNQTLIIMSMTGSMIWAVLNSYMLKLAGVKYKDSVLPGVTVVVATVIVAKLLRMAIDQLA